MDKEGPTGFASALELTLWHCWCCGRSLFVVVFYDVLLPVVLVGCSADGGRLGIPDADDDDRAGDMQFTAEVLES